MKDGQGWAKDGPVIKNCSGGNGQRMGFARRMGIMKK